MSVSVACKPSSVEGGHLSRPIVAEGFKRNPESLTGRLKRSFVSCSEWGLHRGQVARPRVSSYLTFPPLPRRRMFPQKQSPYRKRIQGARRYLSVALFLGSPPAGVTRYPCPMEPGLSSERAFRPRPAAAQLACCLILSHQAANVKPVFIEIFYQTRYNILATFFEMILEGKEGARYAPHHSGILGGP